jgi:hypothetical protein
VWYARFVTVWGWRLSLAILMLLRFNMTLYASLLHCGYVFATWHAAFEVEPAADWDDVLMK